MTIDPLLTFILLGALAGFMGGLLGIGGGIIVIPCLVFLFQRMGFPHEKIMQTVLGTSLSAMVFTAASSAWAHHKKNGSNLNIVLHLFPGIFLGSILGPYLAGILTSETLKMMFSLFIMSVGISLVLSKNHFEPEKNDLPPRFHILISVGFFIGMLSSFFGIGGGIITVPILTHLKVPMKTAISVSAITSFLIAIIGAISFIYLGFQKENSGGSFGYIYLPAFLSIGLAAAFCAPLGANLAYQLPTKIIKRVFGSLLIGIGILLNFST